MTHQTQIVNSLNNPASLLKGITVVAADIDYTLVDFDRGHRAAIQAIRDKFGKSVGDEVDSIFQLILEGHRRPLTEEWEDRLRYEVTMDRVARLHQNFSEQHGTKPWSRETWIALASEQLKKQLDTTAIKTARDLYWQHLAQESTFYDDAVVFLDYIKANSIPLVLMTGSDAILQVEEDGFRYDPDFSDSYKRYRLTSLDFGAHEIVIGDPIDKPDKRFFDRVIAIISNSEQAKDKILFVGDSLRNDLEIPQQLGYKTLLIKR